LRESAGGESAPEAGSLVAKPRDRWRVRRGHCESGSSKEHLAMEGALEPEKLLPLTREQKKRPQRSVCLRHAEEDRARKERQRSIPSRVRGR